MIAVMRNMKYAESNAFLPKVVEQEHTLLDDALLRTQIRHNKVS